MTTTAIIINILFIICLSSSVAPRSMGLVKSDDKKAQRIWIPVTFGLSQGIMAVLGYYVGRLISHLFTYIAEYMVFAMMVVVAVKMFVDSMRVLKGKMMYTVVKESDIVLLSILSAFNTLLISLMGTTFMPFGGWFALAVACAGFLWSFFVVRHDFEPKMLKRVSFLEFSASVFMVVIACLYLFTDLI